jgi:hypothetical protein
VNRKCAQRLMGTRPGDPSGNPTALRHADLQRHSRALRQNKSHRLGNIGHGIVFRLVNIAQTRIFFLTVDLTLGEF